MTRNGLLVDREVWSALRNQVISEMDEAKEKLKSYGFPFPKEKVDIKDQCVQALSKYVQFPDVDPTKTQLRLANQGTMS